jgi:dihydroxyacetone kinase-like predicted kinase
LDQDFVEPHARYADTFATNARESHHVQVAIQKKMVAAENAQNVPRHELDGVEVIPLNKMIELYKKDSHPLRQHFEAEKQTIEEEINTYKTAAKTHAGRHASYIETLRSRGLLNTNTDISAEEE